MVLGNREQLEISIYKSSDPRKSQESSLLITIPNDGPSTLPRYLRQPRDSRPRIMMPSGREEWNVIEKKF